MGVQGLWDILSDLAERKHLKFLSGKRIAVDLSGWVVQATTCKGLETSKNPHIRNLFWRVSRLLRYGAIPIFVIEGDLPALKIDAFKERNQHNSNKTKNSDNIARTKFDYSLSQCQDLLQSLGIPCLKSCGEAEAFCAFLCEHGIVDGVITEDNDAFLYGADSVFRDFTIDPRDPHVSLYSLNSAKNKLKLTRRNLIAIALLLGCDYVKGVPGIGKENALRLLSELKDCDLLQRFTEWKDKDESELFPGYNENLKKLSHCSRCDHLGTMKEHKRSGCKICDSEITCYLSNKNTPCPCDWHKSNEVLLKRKSEIKIYNAVKKVPDFPSSEVISEYLCFKDKIPSEKDLDWKSPNLFDFQKKAFNFLNWTPEKSLQECLPIITAWHQFQLINPTPERKPEFWVEPLQIIKKKVKNGEDFFEVQWKNLRSEGTSEDSGETFFTTNEPVIRFSKAYSQMTEMYNSSKKQNKTKSPTKLGAKPKTNQQADDCKKVMSVSESKFIPSSDTNNEIILQHTLSSPEELNDSYLNLSEQCILSSHVKLNDSHFSFSELPLLERIKILTLNDKKRNIVSTIEQSNEKNPLLNKESDCLFLLDSEESLACIEADSSEQDNSLICGNNFVSSNTKPDLCLKFDDSDDGFLKILSQKERQMQIPSGQSSVLRDKNLTSSNNYLSTNLKTDLSLNNDSDDNFLKILSQKIRQMQIISKQSSISSDVSNSSLPSFSDIYQIQKEAIEVSDSFARNLITKRNNSLCLEFTDSEQSVSIIILEDQKHSLNDSKITACCNEILPSDEMVKPDKENIIPSNINPNSNLKVSARKNDLSPKLIYSVKQSPFHQNSMDSKNFSYISMINSTPYDKALSSKSASTGKLLNDSSIMQCRDQLFEPLVFDSSLDESLSS